MTWQLQEAKNKFSEVVETSLHHGPQVISRRGKETAVLMSFKDYQHFVSPKKGLKRVLLALAPTTPDLDLTRDKSNTGRATRFSL